MATNYGVRISHIWFSILNIIRLIFKLASNRYIANNFNRFKYYDVPLTTNIFESQGFNLKCYIYTCSI
jgi:hypothetical protein